MTIQCAENPTLRRLPVKTLGTTSARWTITCRIPVHTIPIGGLLWAPGTGSGVLSWVPGAEIEGLCFPCPAGAERIVEQKRALIFQAQTTSGVREQASQSSSSAIMELRRLSGLTWDQLACLFRVSPRSLHFWASGKPLTRINEEHLHRLLATIRRLDRGSAQANRALLVSALEDGSIPLDLLSEGKYDQVLSLLWPGQVRHKPAPLSVAARLARTPPPPEFFIATDHEPVHKEVRKARVPRVFRIRQ